VASKPSFNDAIIDIPGIRVGHWTNKRAATGCTVVLAPPEGAVGGVDVRGGAPGTRETELLRPGTIAERAHAVLLTGGSAFGLDAAAGVMRYLEEQGVGFKFADAYIPLVVGAVIFDLGVGSSAVRPEAEAGYHAAREAGSRKSAGLRLSKGQGSVGVGTGCTVAKTGGRERMLKGGVGTACERGPGELLVGAIAAVNCGGEVIDAETGQLIAGPRGDKPGTFLDSLEMMRAERGADPSFGENTTLAVVATNAVLSKAQANRLASVAQDGIARAVRPAHTLSDGDTIFALATCEVEADTRALLAIEALASRAVERAIVRAVISATTIAGVPSVGEWTAGRPRVSSKGDA
jgi:L-aminopeptidase/D-esterase-like protein